MREVVRKEKWDCHDSWSGDNISSAFFRIYIALHIVLFPRCLWNGNTHMCGGGERDNSGHKTTRTGRGGRWFSLTLFPQRLNHIYKQNCIFNPIVIAHYFVQFCKLRKAEGPPRKFQLENSDQMQFCSQLSINVLLIAFHKYFFLAFAAMYSSSGSYISALRNSDLLRAFPLALQWWLIYYMRRVYLALGG